MTVQALVPVMEIQTEETKKIKENSRESKVEAVSSTTWNNTILLTDQSLLHATYLYKNHNCHLNYYKYN